MNLLPLRWRTLGGPLAPPARQGVWAVGGLALEIVAGVTVVVFATRYGNRTHVPSGVVAALIAAVAVNLAGAVLLSRAVALGRAALGLGIIVFFLWPVWLVGAVLLFLASIGPGSQPLTGAAGGTGRLRESRGGKRRRAREAQKRREAQQQQARERRQAGHPE